MGAFTILAGLISLGVIGYVLGKDFSNGDIHAIQDSNASSNAKNPAVKATATSPPLPTTTTATDLPPFIATEPVTPFSLLTSSLVTSSHNYLHNSENFMTSITAENAEENLRFKSSSRSHSYSRNPRFFPFYTIGRFPNEVCTGANLLQGTCVVRGECHDNDGVSAGSCSTVTQQAVCCVYQRTCGATTKFNNTYFSNAGYPGTYPGGGRCSIIVEPCDQHICQLRIDFRSLSLAPPNGDGYCVTDSLTVVGGSSRVPSICGENSGQHVYVDFNGDAPITISVATTGSYTFNRQWQIQIAQIACASATQAPSGCLQYYMDDSHTVSSFNYDSGAAAQLNSIGVPGTRQIANERYGICIRMGANMCSITWSQVGSDSYSFTLTNDVGAVDPALLATEAVQSQDCTTDFIIIPNPTQNGVTLPSDRFCGLGLVETVSSTKPFVLYVVTDGNEDMDISNRGFFLSYSQNGCPII